MRYENLDVWKRACRLSVEVYKHFKDSKDFGFKDQITRCSLSIGSNIAEGMEKDSNKDKIRFLNISEGSIAELITQIYIGIEIDYIEKEIGMKWKNELNELSKMIKSLRKSINNKEN
ncbi:MAG: four helix bundle protein [Campylobacterota bacterium]|nr:four helix bundle protein [Campylobacterota bacterium]